MGTVDTAERRVARAMCDFLEDALEHIRESSTPAIGLASMIYGIRLRQAEGDVRKKSEAIAEAKKHDKIIIRSLPRHALSPELPPRRPTPVYVNPFPDATRHEE
jgi:hypothetical protein